jgi:hypothetical protein
LAALFPQVVKPRREAKKEVTNYRMPQGLTGWMGN